MKVRSDYFLSKRSVERDELGVGIEAPVLRAPGQGWNLMRVLQISDACLSKSPSSDELVDEDKDEEISEANPKRN